MSIGSIDLIVEVEGRFPVGTTVGLYPDSEEVRARLNEVPQSAAVKTAVVQSNGTVTFTGVSTSTSYFMYADVGGEKHWVATRTLDLDNVFDNITVIDQVHEDADYFQWISADGDVLGRMDSGGNLLLGRNPDYTTFPDSPQQWAAHDFILVRALETVKGSGRLYVRNIRANMVNDPADMGFAMGKGTLTGNLTVLYSTGTVDVTAGSVVVVGHGTAWASQDFAHASIQFSSGPPRLIDEVVSDTELRLTDIYSGDTASDQTYSIGTNGYPFGPNGDGTGLWPAVTSTAIGNIGAIPLLPTGNFSGYCSRLGWKTTEDPRNVQLDATLSLPWNTGDSVIHLNEDPAAVQQTQNNGVDNQGAAFGTAAMKHHGTVTVLLDSGKTASVEYAHYVSADKVLLGCRDTGTAVGTASAGARVRQFQGFRAGRTQIAQPYKGTSGTTEDWRLNEDGSNQIGEATIQAGATAFFEVMGGGGRFRPNVDPVEITYATGTVSATNGSAVITGSGTIWLTNVYKAAKITINGHDYAVKSVDSNTQITLNSNFAESTASGLSYTAQGGVQLFGSNPGTTKRNYYVIQRNELGDRSAPLKINVPYGLPTYGSANFLRLEWTPKNGWTQCDVCWVTANADGSDNGTGYTFIATGLGLFHNASAKRVGTIVDAGQTVSAPSDYDMTSVVPRNTSGDLKAGFLTLEQGLATKTRVTGTTGDLKVTGQDLTVDGTDGVVCVSTSGGARDVYLPTVASKIGRQVTILDTSGSAGANNITIHANGTDTINGSATYVINTNRGSVTIVSIGSGVWRIVAKV